MVVLHEATQPHAVVLACQKLPVTGNLGSCITVRAPVRAITDADTRAAAAARAAGPGSCIQISPGLGNIEIQRKKKEKAMHCTKAWQLSAALLPAPCLLKTAAGGGFSNLPKYLATGYRRQENFWIYSWPPVRGCHSPL